MKSIFLAMATMTVALSANAQLLKSKLLSGYNVNDNLEKTIYQNADNEPILNVWTGAFASKPSTAPSPTIAEGMTYAGYPETGLSIQIGMPDGIKGNRFSVYPIDTKKTYSKGVLYLACVINMDKVTTSTPIDVIGLSASATKVSNRSAIKIVREGADRLRFSTSLLKSQAVTSMAYEYDKPHLVILKLDYANQSASLFVNPTLDAEPTQADCVAKGDTENVLKHAIRSISFRNRSGNTGRIGNIRLARTWSDLFVAQ